MGGEPPRHCERQDMSAHLALEELLLVALSLALMLTAHPTAHARNSLLRRWRTWRGR
jgi:phosphoenolpyruvate carboxylase